jgi:hypothetical protein
MAQQPQYQTMSMDRGQTPPISKCALKIKDVLYVADPKNTIKIKGLANECPQTLFKHSIKKNNLFKK